MGAAERSDESRLELDEVRLFVFFQRFLKVLQALRVFFVRRLLKVVVGFESYFPMGLFSLVFFLLGFVLHEVLRGLVE